MKARTVALDRLFTPYTFDLEVTNLCNTRCAFCPREEIKRPQGRMTEETFSLFLNRLKSFAHKMEKKRVYFYQEKWEAVTRTGDSIPPRVFFSGMGECLTYRHTPEWVGRIRSEVGVRASIITNGSLLDEEVVKRLGAADVSSIVVSIHGVDRESYEHHMKLDWDTVLGNVERAHAMLPGRVCVTVTVPRNASGWPHRIKEFWKERGIPIAGVCRCHSRGGFLKDRTLITLDGPVKSPFCAVFARSNFVAWDGRILSCCHDLLGENVMGTVHLEEMPDVFRRKNSVIRSRTDFDICKRCDDIERAKFENILLMDEEALL